MAAGNDSNRNTRDIGSDSPASEEAKEQGMSGNKGAQSEQMAGAGGQPSQASNRRNEQKEPLPEQRRDFAPGHAPSEQGETDHPSPHVIAQHQQGIGRQSGSHGAQGDRSTERAMAGEPREEHTRQGRQSVPGDREQNNA